MQTFLKNNAVDPVFFGLNIASLSGVAGADVIFTGLGNGERVTFGLETDELIMLPLPVLTVFIDVVSCVALFIVLDAVDVILIGNDLGPDVIV